VKHVKHVQKIVKIVPKSAEMGLSINERLVKLVRRMCKDVSRSVEMDK
jgi:hypothetical protein